MAVTEQWGPSWLNIGWDGTSDYLLTKSIGLRAIRFYPSAPNDVLAVRQEIASQTNTDNWPMMKLVSTDGSPVAMFEPYVGNNLKKCKYLIDYSECTFNTASSVIIQFVYE